LAGQPELNDKLDLPEMAQLTQRVRLRFHLTPLSREDLEHYIKHRLEIAGAKGREIFAPDTYDLIYQYTGGVPRLVNTLCDTTMMAAFAEDQDTISLNTLKTAIDELRWTDFATRSAKLTAHQAGQSIKSQGKKSEQPLAHIQLSHKGKLLGEYPIKVGRIVIGRIAENDIQIDSNFISRHHAQIITNEETCIIEDLNSTNGISFQQKRVRRKVLHNGDVLQVGEHELTYTDNRNLRRRSNIEDTDVAIPMLSETVVLSAEMGLPHPSANLESTFIKE